MHEVEQTEEPGNKNTEEQRVLGHIQHEELENRGECTQHKEPEKKKEH